MSLWVKRRIQMKAKEQQFPVVLFIMLYVFRACDSVDEIWHSNES